MILDSPMRSDSERGGHRGIVRTLLLVVLTVMIQMAAPVSASAQNASPLSAADQDLLIRVRQAGLWEMPAGDWAMQHGTDAKLMPIGRTLMTDHGRLDVLTRQM